MDGKVGSIIYRETGLEVNVMNTIRGAFDWTCCYLNEGGVDLHKK